MQPAIVSSCFRGRTIATEKCREGVFDPVERRCTRLRSGDYLQNHCEQNSANCVPGEDRLPSCINLPDNNNPYPGKLDSEYYIKCYRNRTVSVEACQVSKYNPATRQCSENVSPGGLTETSQLLGPSGRARKNTSGFGGILRGDNPTSIIRDPENCGRYYNCSDPSTVQGLNKPYLRECTYPKLFASPTVHDGEYVENQCFVTNCEPCESKFPSCIGKPDGSNVFPAKENTGYYIVCYRQRTVAIVSCNQRVYSHSERACVSDPKPAIA
uniref:Chitin-binding type-2 domain-containing protein n=1 Tax=Magallana gigas TaxID=29159 RepID=A0A8W8J0X8_MAGGI